MPPLEREGTMCPYFCCSYPVLNLHQAKPKMPKVHVLLKKEELDAELLAGKVVVVLDILFATSTIVTAFQHGVTHVIPAMDEHHARREAEKHAVGSYL